jgi:hypothetical protein
MVSSNNKIVSSRFFEQTNFEQMIMTQTPHEKEIKSQIDEVDKINE